MIQKTLVLVKPDGVQRGLIGESLKRFEQRGFKIIALKLVKVDEEFAKKHYTEDITKRKGEVVRQNLLKFITSGPVVAMIIEGVNAIENIRKIVGPTESREALPGTIRGDFTHVSYSYCDQKNIPIKNIIHASANEEDAKSEIELWFSQKEIVSYKRCEDEHILE